MLTNNITLDDSVGVMCTDVDVLMVLFFALGPSIVYIELFHDGQSTLLSQSVDGEGCFFYHGVMLACYSHDPCKK
jgi:hypothetical protein